MQLAAIHDEMPAAARAYCLQGPYSGAKHGRCRQDDPQSNLVDFLVGHEIAGLRGEGEPVNAVSNMLDVHEVRANRVANGDRLHHDMLVQHCNFPKPECFYDFALGRAYQQRLEQPASNQSVLVRCNRVHGEQVANAGFWTPWTARGWRS